MALMKVALIQKLPLNVNINEYGSDESGTYPEVAITATIDGRVKIQVEQLRCSQKYILEIYYSHIVICTPVERLFQYFRTNGNIKEK